MSYTTTSGKKDNHTIIQTKQLLSYVSLKFTVTDYFYFYPYSYMYQIKHQTFSIWFYFCHKAFNTHTPYIKIKYNK